MDIAKFDQLAGRVFDKRTLARRLHALSYQQATLLRPENVIESARLLPNLAQNYFSLPPSQQRIRLAELLGNTWTYSRDAICAIETVPREEFVSPPHKLVANWNGVNLLKGKTAIESAWLLGYTATCLELTRGQRILVPGSGTGYSVAMAGAIVGDHDGGEVIGLEIDAALVTESNERLKFLGYRNCKIVLGDALRLIDLGEFDAVWPTLSTPGIPRSWFNVLKVGSKVCAYLPSSVTMKPSILVPPDLLGPEWSAPELLENLCLTTYKKGKTLVPVAKLCGLVNSPFIAPGATAGQYKDFDEFGELERTACELLTI